MRLALVVLVACSGGTPREPTPPPRVVVDASIDVPIDAAVAAKYYGACDWSKRDPDNPRCAFEHMPRPLCPPGVKPDDGPHPCKERPTLPPPKPDPVVLKIKKRGEWTTEGVRITVDGGTNRGIDKTWNAVLIDAKQRAFPGGDLSYRRLDPDEIEGVVRLHPEVLEGLKSVRFTPP